MCLHTHNCRSSALSITYRFHDLSGFLVFWLPAAHRAEGDIAPPRRNGPVFHSSLRHAAKKLPRRQARFLLCRCTRVVEGGDGESKCSIAWDGRVYPLLVITCVFFHAFRKTIRSRSACFFRLGRTFVKRLFLAVCLRLGDRMSALSRFRLPSLVVCSPCVSRDRASECSFVLRVDVFPSPRCRRRRRCTFSVGSFFVPVC